MQSRQGRILYIHAPRRRTPPPARRLAGTSPRRLPPGDCEPVTGLRREPRARRGRPVKRGGAFTWARGGDWWSGDWILESDVGRGQISFVPRPPPPGLCRRAPPARKPPGGQVDMHLAPSRATWPRRPATPRLCSARHRLSGILSAMCEL